MGTWRRHDLCWLLLSLTPCLWAVSCCIPDDDLRVEVAEQHARIDELQTQVDELSATTAELQEKIADLETPRPRRTPRGGPRGQVERTNKRCQDRDGTFVFPDLESLDWEALAREARVVPHYADGEALGFKLYSIREDSLLRSCGFQSADIIRTVNDLPLVGPESALEAYASLQDVEELIFEIERGSTTVEIRIATE
jgi:hypothetical protein